MTPCVLQVALLPLTTDESLAPAGDMWGSGCALSLWMPAGCLGCRSCPCIAMALGSPFMGKVWLFGPQKGRHPRAATSTVWEWMSPSGHGIFWLVFWGGSGLALVLGIWHQGNSLGVANRGLVLWSRIQGSEGIVNIFRIITSGKKCVRDRLWGSGSTQGEKACLLPRWAKKVLPWHPLPTRHRKNP